MENINTNLRTLLAHNIVRFTFQKVDGTIRHAVGTRNLDIARAKTGVAIPTPKGEEQPYSYYDIEKMGWRSYKPELLISIDGITPVEYADLRKPVKEIPVEKPVSKPTHTEREKGEEMPLGGGFGFGGFGGGMPLGGFGGGKGEPVKGGKVGGMVGTPVFAEDGLALPVGAVSVEDFAKLVAKYVVDLLAYRLAQ